jgi:hypothetical protein
MSARSTAPIRKDASAFVGLVLLLAAIAILVSVPGNAPAALADVQPRGSYEGTTDVDAQVASHPGPRVGLRVEESPRALPTPRPSAGPDEAR